MKNNKDFKNDKSEILISKIMDKIDFCISKNKIQTTDFLSQEEQKSIEKSIKSNGIKNYIITGGFIESERKMFLFYPDKLENIVDKINLNEFINAIRIILPNEKIGEYSHKNYLSALIKLGITRDKIGDIIVDDKGADIIIKPEICKFLLLNLPSLTRFSKSRIEKISLEELREINIKTEIIKITVASMRLDNIVSELAHCSRAKANEILEQERVLINHETFAKASKEIKVNDIVTIRGKGRFIIKDIVGESKKGRLFIEVEKFI